jgi:glutamate racemase
MKIGVFDSGIGGLSVATAIELAFPDDEIVFVDDRQHLPYGTKKPDELYTLVLPILQKLEAEGCGVILVACNTVTTTIIQKLRKELRVPLVGTEPMVKPACEQTRSKIIAVCATPTTLASDRYKELKRQYADGVTVLEPDCSDWSAMIDSNSVNHRVINERIKSVCQQGADVIVLGCTHYHWIEEDIKTIARKRAQVIQPEAALVEQLKLVLSQQ